MSTTRQCAQCGAEFKPKAKNQEYCSGYCRNRAQYLRSKERGAPYLKKKPKAETKPKPKPAAAPIVKRCEFCKVDFVARFDFQKYCSGKCRKNRENERIRQKTAKTKQREAAGIWKYTKTCVICGEEFKTNNKKRQACSTDCIRIHRRTTSSNARNGREETRAQKKTRENREKWGAIEAKCNALGLSYGQAVARGLID